MLLRRGRDRPLMDTESKIPIQLTQGLLGYVIPEGYRQVGCEAWDEYEHAQNSCMPRGRTQKL